MPAARIPADLDAQAALYRSLLAGRRMLIVLDNARDAEQVRPLLPGTPGCLVLVTSRNQLSGLVAADGAHPLVARRLLSRPRRASCWSAGSGADRVAAEPRRRGRDRRRCARLPLALAIVAARAATHPASRWPSSPPSWPRPATAWTRSAGDDRPSTSGRCSPGRTQR